MCIATYICGVYTRAHYLSPDKYVHTHIQFVLWVEDALRLVCRSGIIWKLSIQ